MRRLLPPCALVAAALIASVASARTPGERHRGPGARAIPRTSRSIGYPWRGTLRGGVRAAPNAFMRHTGEYVDGGAFHGTWELVQLLERAAYRVWRRAPGAKLSVGELSSPGGGEIAGHSSHENGRDVDIAFYMLDARGRPFEPYAFAEFDSAGRGRPPNQALRFDDTRNWELVAKLVADGDARVQFIFVGRAVRRRLLDAARRRGAPTILIERAERVLVQPAEGHPHRNHFHLRIYCPPSDRPSCEDRPPFHPWYPGGLPSAPALVVAPLGD